MRGHVLKRGWLKGGAESGEERGKIEGSGGRKGAKGLAKARALVSGERRTGKCNRVGWWGGGCIGGSSYRPH